MAGVSLRSVQPISMIEALVGAIFPPAPYIGGMIRITISAAAFKAIAAMLPLGSVGGHHRQPNRGPRPNSRADRPLASAAYLFMRAENITAW
jgi:hypothetical protein